MDPTITQKPVPPEDLSRLAAVPGGDRLSAVREHQTAAWSAGHSTPVEAYIQQVPGLTDGDVLVLIMAEAGLRTERGEAPSAAEYQARFPVLMADIDLQFRVAKPLSAPSLPPTAADPGTQTLVCAPGNGAWETEVVSPPGYELQKELGVGGMGVVYLAAQAGLNRAVALKVMKRNRADPMALVRFLAEGEAVAAVRHPRVVEVYAFGEAGGCPYLAMEYLPGGSLADRLSAGPLDPAAAAQLVADIADGVEAAHERGIVHRDLKPGNILFDAAGGPKVTDFGLAKRIEADLTQTTAYFGTPAYMAPEQARGRNKFVGPPADVHALGAILYECLTGTRPFRNPDPVELLRAVAEDPPPSLRRAVPALPRDLELICLKCLAKEPRDRYPTAGALAEDLRRFGAGRPVTARPLGAGAQAWRWCRRNPRAAALVGAAVAFLVAVALGSAVVAELLREERDAALDAKTKMVEADRARRQELYRAYLGQAQGHRTSGQVGQRFAALKALQSLVAAVPREELSAEQLAAIREEAVAAMTLVDVAEVRRRPSGSVTYHDSDSDPVADVCCYSDPTGRCTVVRRGDGTEVRLPEYPPAEPLLRVERKFGPDGRLLAELLLPSAHLVPPRLRIWDWAAGRPVFDQVFPVWAIHALAFHPSAPELATVSGAGAIGIVSLTGDAEVLRVTPGRHQGNHIQYSPDGSLLAVTGWSAPPAVVDARTLETVANVPRVQSVGPACWSPDGRELVLTTPTGLFVWERKSKLTRPIPGERPEGLRGVLYSPDGSLIASAGPDGSTRFWSVPEERWVLSIPERVVRFAPDGRRLTASGQSEVVYELAPASAYRIIRGQFAGAEFSPDGAYLVVSSWRGVQFLAADTLTPRGDLGLDDCGPVAFRPDGGELVTIGRFTRAWRWPVQTTADGVQVGPPTPVIPGMAFGFGSPWKFKPQLDDGRKAAWSRDGRSLALLADNPATVATADLTGRAAPRVISKFQGADQLAVSPDGAWIAAAKGPYESAHVWRADGTPVAELPGRAFLAFSPDGRWLAAAGRTDIGLYRVGTWECVHTLPRDDADPLGRSPVAFQPGTGLLAAATSRSKIRLYDPESGRSVVVLVHPKPESAGVLRFSPDGRRLAVTRGGSEVGVWDLAGLGAGLSALGLPADAFPAGGPAPTARPVRVDRGSAIADPLIAVDRFRLLAIEESWKNNLLAAASDARKAYDAAPPEATKLRAELLNLRADYNWRAGAFWAAQENWEAALGMEPGLTDAAVGLARLCLLGPETIREPARAFAVLAPFAGPESAPPFARLLFGLAHVRLGQARAGLTVLDTVEPKEGGPLRDLARALALHQLGERDAARAAVPDAETSGAAGTGARDELTRFREEVLRALGPPKP